MPLSETVSVRRTLQRWQKVKNRMPTALRLRLQAIQDSVVEASQTAKELRFHGEITREQYQETQRLLLDFCEPLLSVMSTRRIKAEL